MWMWEPKRVDLYDAVSKRWIKKAHRERRRAAGAGLRRR